MICGTWLGNIEANREVTVQLPCRNYRSHRVKDHVQQFEQSKHGVITYRSVPKHERTVFDDDGVRINASIS